MPQEFVDEVLAGITPQLLSEYPEMAGFTHAYADFLGVQPANLCLVNGSSEGVRYAVEGFTAPGGTIVGVAPSYAMYQVYARMYGRRYVAVPYTHELQMPVERIVDALSPDVQLLVLLNPNNPVGNAYSEEEMARVMAAARENEITVLIDEAYHYFYPNTFLEYALHDEHVLVTRTFSKLCSLAGCRLGAVIGRPATVDIVQRLCTPHNVNVFALRFAQALVERPDVLQRLVDEHADGRDYLARELGERGYEFLPGAGNFAFVRPHTSARELVCVLKEREGILVKAYDDMGYLGDCLRVTTAARPYMQRFVEALDRWDA